MGLATVFLVTIFLFFFFRKKRELIVPVFLYGCLGVGVLLTSHGATIENLVKLDPATLAFNYSNTPKDESAKALDLYEKEGNLDGYALIFFRFDCPDCTQNFSKMANEIKDSKALCISTRSLSGKELVKIFGIRQVPTIVKQGRICSDLAE